ncbi:MAG: sulfatase [Cytophagia bacterium]|nr:sulfatase [Cytophagia bacterium]
MIKRLSLLVILISLFGCSEEASKSPNIILFFVDDMGWQDTSVPFWSEQTYFNKRYHTPNMERLATEGMKFTQAYATSVCSPTRVSLITGMNAARHRVTNWTLEKDVQPVADDQFLQQPDWNVNGLSPVAGLQNTVFATPFPQLLKDAGYQTIHVGKAHFGAIGTPGADPLNLGFNVNVAGHAAGAPGSYYGSQNFGNDNNKSVWAVPGLEKYHGQDVYLSEALTREAILHVEESIIAERPFFLYMAHYAVHTPIQGDNRFLQKYYDLGIDSTEAKYASMVEGMDKSLGDLMDLLEKEGIEDNTIIIFMSDNGGLSAVARGGEKHTHNYPLSSGKGSAREGGIREPMIVKWPERVKAGTTTSSAVIIEDFFPTILEMAGVDEYRTSQVVDGMSFSKVLEGAQGDHERPLFWHYPNRWGPTGPGIGSTSTVRLGDWKLIYYHKDRSFELFNLIDDISESNNLVSANPAKLQELAQVLTDYLISVDAQMPIDKSTGKTVEWPVEAIDR